MLEKIKPGKRDNQRKTEKARKIRKFLTRACEVF
jgi:hypothetical protein